MPSIVELPKRQRSGAYRFTDEERDETLKLLSEAKTEQGVVVTEPFMPETKAGKAPTNEAVTSARNIASGRNNTIREALEPHIDPSFHIKMHVIPTDDGFVGAVSLRAGAKPARKERKKTLVRRRKNETDAQLAERKTAAETAASNGSAS